jgi:membrane associated rhomboid family serine protease
MIPIRDSPQSSTFPVVTVLLVLANILAFLAVSGLGPEASGVVEQLAFVPERFFQWPGGALDAERWWPLFTAMFLHANLIHLVSNLWFLWLFGDNVEDRLGHGRYLVFYLLCGMASFLAHGLSAPGSTLPSLGASGAISGVLGGYLVLFSRARILTLIPIVFIPWFVEVPAAVFIGIWFLLQFIYGTASQASGAALEGGVAWWAHIGGFLVGVVLCWVLRRPGAGPPARPWVARGPRGMWLPR